MPNLHIDIWFDESDNTWVGEVYEERDIGVTQVFQTVNKDWNATTTDISRYLNERVMGI
jgi:hypothetical protein